MGLTVVDFILLAAPLIILYAIYITLESVEKECGNTPQHKQSVKEKKENRMHDQYLTIPNALTLLRILLLAPILIYFYSGFWFLTLGLFMISAITDMLDGMIARRWRMESQLGRMFDPLADKVTFVTLIALFGWGVLHRELLLVLLGAELVLLLIGGYTYFRPRMQRRITLGANIFGKIKTRLETLLVALLILWHFFTQPDIFYLQVILFASICFALASIIRHVHIHPLY
ncbi:MAG: CDP-alcohol phosphatidyltransferase family protein [Patescibacteria group bacterium]